MGRSLNEVMSGFSPEERAKVEAGAARLRVEISTLAEIRKSRGLSQKALADEMGITQPAVSQIEKESDMMLSRLQNHIESLGGTLRLIASFPDRPDVEVTLGDLVATSEDALAAE